MRSPRLLVALACSAVAVAIVTADAKTAHAQGTDSSPFVMPGEAPSTAPPPPAARPRERTGPVAPDFGSEEPLDERAPAMQPTGPVEPAPTVVLEAPAPPFGSEGEFLVTTQTSMGIDATSFSGSDASSFGFTVAPGLDYFLVDHLSIGFEFGFSYEHSKGYDSASNLLGRSSTTTAGGPRIGFALPLGRHLSWYPRVTLGVESTHRSDAIAKASQNAAEASSPTGIPTTTKTGPYVTVFAPLLIHAAPHFFIGVGPYAFTEFANTQGGPEIGGQRTTFGGRLELGGWWGGSPQTVAVEEMRPRPRFGMPRQFVFTGSFQASGWSTDYAGTPARANLVYISPSFDYFFAPHVAIGLMARYSTGSTKDVTSTGRVETFARTTFELGPRLGVDLPLSPWFSFYARGAITIGEQDFEAKTDGAQNKYSASLITASLYAPLLFHFASHAFVGFGPELTHDLVAAYGDDGVENAGTSIGASFTVGGWL